MDVKKTLARSSRMILGLTMILGAFAGQAHAAASIPEIDPGSLASAVTLVAGALMLVKGRRSK